MQVSSGVEGNASTTKTSFGVGEIAHHLVGLILPYDFSKASAICFEILPRRPQLSPDISIIGTNKLHPSQTYVNSPALSPIHRVAIPLESNMFSLHLARRERPPVSEFPFHSTSRHQSFQPYLRSIPTKTNLSSPYDMHADHIHSKIQTTWAHRRKSHT